MNTIALNTDPQEFGKLTTPFMTDLYAYGMRLTSEPDDANDLVQETLLRAFRYFHLFERGTNLKGWLFKILRNTFINEYRRKAKAPQNVDYDDIQNFYENIKPSEISSSHVENDSFHDTFDDEIKASLDTLPDDFRTVIILSDLEGMTYEEISEFVDIPIGTVRSRLHRARKMLYSKLYHYAKRKGFVNEKPEKASAKTNFAMSA